MKHTNRQTTRRTLTDLYRALDHRQAVTITYRDRDGATTIRTVEPQELRTTNSGSIILIAMCRLRAAELAARTATGEDTTGETAEREFRISGILTYTLHRARHVLTRPEPTTYQRPAPAPADDSQALFFHELARDQDDVDYRARIPLTQTDTDLAA